MNYIPSDASYLELIRILNENYPQDQVTIDIESGEGLFFNGQTSEEEYEIDQIYKEGSNWFVRNIFDDADESIEVLTHSMLTELVAYVLYEENN